MDKLRPGLCWAVLRCAGETGVLGRLFSGAARTGAGPAGSFITRPRLSAAAFGPAVITGLFTARGQRASQSGPGPQRRRTHSWAGPVERRPPLPRSGRWEPPDAPHSTVRAPEPPPPPALSRGRNGVSGRKRPPRFQRAGGSACVSQSVRTSRAAGRTGPLARLTFLNGRQEEPTRRRRREATDG